MKTHFKTNCKIYGITIILFILITIFNYKIFATDYASIGNGNWNNPLVWSPNGIPGTGDNVQINGHTITLNRDELINHITINGGSISIGNFSFTINGDLNGIARDNLISTAGSKLVIAGSSGVFNFPAGISKLQKLTINRSAGAYLSASLDLDDAVPADSIVLVLLNGIVEIDPAAKILLNSHAIQKYIPLSGISFVDGIVSRNIKKGAGMYFFPLGNNTISRMMSLEVNTGGVNDDNTNECRFIKQKPVNYNYIDWAKLPGGITDKFYWLHTKVNGANTRRRLYYEDSDFSALTPIQKQSDLLLANNSGVPAIYWSTQTTPVYVDIVNRFVEFTNSNASNDNYWTFGSQSESSPLPIQQIGKFTGSNDKGKIQLVWNVFSDNTASDFDILRSEDGKNFEKIGTVAQQIKNQEADYQYIDISKKEAKIYYYKLKTNDINLKPVYSDMIAVRVSQEVEEFSVSESYPNPVNKGNLSINLLLPEEGEVVCTIFNAAGKEVKKFTTNRDKGSSVMSVSLEELSKGAYFYTLQYNLKLSTGKFIKLKNTKEDSLLLYKKHF